MSIKLKKIVTIIYSLLLVIIFISCSSRENYKQLEEHYEFDNNGRLISKTTPDGSEIKYKYNENGLPIEINSPKGNVEYSYDENGNRVSMVDDNGKTTYEYDAFDRLTEVVYNYSPERKVNYEYDPFNRITSIKISDDNNNYEVKYEHNIIGNIISVDNGSCRITYDYNPDKGEIVRHLPNGVSSIFTYSSFNNITSIKHVNANYNLIASYSYEYNPAGKITTVTEEVQEGRKETKYEWDSQGYLIALHLPNNETISYEYDAMGNRLSMTDSEGTITYEYDNFGRLVKGERTKYKWNKNGNVIIQFGKNGRFKFIYGINDQPTSIKTRDSEIKYLWDGDGNLISRDNEDEVTHYLPSPLSPMDLTLSEYGEDGRMKTAYLYGDGLIGQKDINGNMQYFLEDGFNSIRYVIDRNGNTINKQDYTPFGELSITKGESVCNFRTAGERYLPEINKYFIESRLYDPGIGRYLSPDKETGFMERFDSFNKYTHGQQNPSNFMEPNNNQTHNKIDIFIGGVDARNPQLSHEVQFYGYNKGIPVNRGWRRVDGFLAFLDQVTGGGLTKTKENLLTELLRQGEIGTLGAHSHGAITLGNSAKELDDALLQNKISIDKVIIYGAYRNDKLIKVLKRHKIPIENVGSFPGVGSPAYRNLYYDPVVLGTMTSLSIGETYFPNAHPIIKSVIGTIVKIEAFKCALPFYPGQYSFEAHTLDYLIGRKEKKEAGIFGFFTHFYENFYTPLSSNNIKHTDELQKIDISPHRNDLEPNVKKEPFIFPPKDPDYAAIDPFIPIEDQLGGIELGSTAEFTGYLGNIKGVMYDEENECLVLAGDTNKLLPSIKIEDLALAIAFVNGNSPQDPQFSLDPADSYNPWSEWLRKVYIPDTIKGTSFDHISFGNTSFGNTMFEADWLLKQYAMGVMFNSAGRIVPRNCSIPGFKSIADILFEQHSAQGESLARYWIVSDEMRLKESDNAIYFDVATMRVKTKKLVIGPTGITDADTDEYIVGTRFVEIFTELYDEIAQESPYFEKVRELAKAVAIAKWFRKKQISVDMNLINECVNDNLEYPERVRSLSKTWTRHTSSWQLFGGVDLSIESSYQENNEFTKKFENNIKSKLNENINRATFTTEIQGENLNCVVLPFTDYGNKAKKDGIVYEFEEFNGKKKVVKRIDETGNTIDYGYDVDQKLKTVKLSNKNGWSVKGERNESNSLWTITNPRKNSFKYKYDTDGLLKDVEVNGEKYVTYDYDSELRPISKRYSNCTEVVKYDEQGNITQYEIQKPSSDLTQNNEMLFFSYDNFGNLINIEGSGISSTNILYSANSNKPTKITSPLGELNYSYNADGQVKQILHSSGFVTSYKYDNGTLSNMEVNFKDKKAEHIFNNYGIAQIKDLLGGITNHDYTNGLLSLVNIEQFGEAKYSYDNKNRLKEMFFPDGSRVEYKYEDAKSDDQDLNASTLKRLVIISHCSGDN